MTLALLWVACSGGEPVILGDLLDDGLRVDPVEVTFNLWTDYIPLLGALHAEDCHWLEPTVDDDTTPWPPLQAFWIIYDDPNDVTADDIIDTYFVGDGLRPGDFSPREGLDPLGFKPFTGFQQSLLAVDEIRRPDPMILEADFGSPIDATVRLVAAPDCTVTSDFCQRVDDASCDADMPLSRIHLDLGTFFNVLDVRFE